jgi:hypothetical protein
MKKVLILFAIIFGGIVLYFVAPEDTAWLPKCGFYMLTGLKCPACGSQRALHQLLHLHFKAAFRYNPFLILSWPYAAALVYLQWFHKGNKLNKIKSLCFHRTTVNAYLLLMIAWWILRNVYETTYE